jgi:hypothetical protein
MENPNPQSNSPEDDLVEKAAKQLFNGQGLGLSMSIPSQDGPNQDDSSSMQTTNDDIYDLITTERDRIFDTTSSEGKEVYLKFEEANSRRNKWTFENFKQMVNIVGGVPSDIMAGVARNLTPSNYQKILPSVADGVLRDVRDLVGLLTQSEDPSSPLFKFKDFINGTGTVESRMKQFNEARWWGNRSNDLEQGNADILSEWVPEGMRETAEKLIDRKFANALSYIGLDVPHMLRDMYRRKGLADSVKAFKSIDAAHIAVAKDVAESANWFDNNASKFERLHYKLTGKALVATASVASKPFDFIKEKILKGEEAIEARLGYVPNEYHNGASTFLSDITERTVKDPEIGPIKGILFSLGVKPIAEYANVLGNELIDASQGVVSSNSAFAGHDMLGRLALNGGRIRMSKEAQAVAKFTNVVVGWPASMAFPTFKRAVGDAAYMGVLGYANARGEGASSGMGVGFAWGGMSGALRHIHNVYNHSIAHERIIENFDNTQLKQIYKQAPEHAENIREYLKDVDAAGDARVSATVRAQFMMGWHAAPDARLKYATVEQLVAEYGADAVIPQLDNFNSAKNSMGADMVINGKSVIWINREKATPETGVHEYSHRFLDVLFKRNDNSAHEAVRRFIGKTTNGGAIPDALMARLIADYSMRRFLTKPDANWLNGKASAVQYPDKDGNLKTEAGYGNIAYVMGQLSEMRRSMETDPNSPFTVQTNKDTGETKFQIFHEFPVIEKLMHEVFAYNQSNSLLRKSPDIFLRDPSYRSVKATMENWFTLLNQRKVNDMEAAGVLVRKKTTEGGTLLESIFWDDGKFMSLGTLDTWTESVMKDVMRYGDVNVMTLSGDRAEAYMKQNGKMRFLNGSKIKSKKEIEEQITKDADAIASTLEALPDSVKPKWTVMSNGSKRINLADLSEDAWKSIRDSEIYSIEEYNLLRGMVDVIKQVDAGKPVFNTYTGQYMGHSQQVVEAALGQRLKGYEVPVTLRHFAPFSIELIVSKVDEFGKALRNPRSHVTVNAMDVSVLNRRKMNMWQRPDVKSLFRDFGHFSETFVGWYEQHSLDPSIRKPSAEFLKAEFGSDAVRVRDIMYEVWGGRKRNDESYINAPEGYAGGRDGPNYPIHSLRFDLLANVLKQSQIFPEAFRGDVGGLRFNLGVAYEPMRRNAMIGGFVERELGNGRKFYTDGNGYEIRGTGSRLQLFNMYGNLVGVFKTMARAQAAAERDISKVPPEELTSLEYDMGDRPMNETIVEVKPSVPTALAGGSNMMISSNGSANVEIDTRGVPYKSFILRATDYQRKFEEGTLGLDYNKSPRVKVVDLLANKADVLRVLPEADRYFIEIHPMAELQGGWVPAMVTGPQASILGYASLNRFTYKGSVQTLASEINEQFQKIIELKENRSSTKVVPHASDSPLFDVTYATSRAVSMATQDVARANNITPSQVTQPMLLQHISDESEKYVERVKADWIGTAKISQNYINRLSRTGPLGQFSNGLPRVNGNVQSYLSGYIADNKTLREMNDWACDITEALEKRKILQVNVMGGAFVFMDKAYLDLPMSVELLMKTDPIFRKNLKRFLMNSTLLHGVSKQGDRDVSDKTAANVDAFERENLALGDPNFLDNPTPDANDPFVIRGFPLVANQSNSAVGTLFGGNGTVIVTVTKNDVKSAFYGTRNPRFNLTTEGASFMQGLGGDDKPMGMTQSPANSRSGPLVGSLSKVRGTIMDITSESIMGGYAPFLGAGRTGVFHSNYSNGTYITTLATLGNAIGVPYDPQKHSGEAGMSLYVQILSDAGIDTPDKAFVHRYAKGVLMIESGRGILNGDSNRTYAKWDRANQRSGKGARLDADQVTFGENLVNAGYGQIAYAIAMSKDSLDKLRPAERRRTKKTKPQRASFIEKAMTSDKKSAQFSRNVQPLVDGVIQAIQRDGFESGSLKNTGVSRSMMIGGFHGSTAREVDMIADGALRIVKTDSGKTYKAFEFSDKNASFITEKVGGKLHLIPFIKGGSAAFDSYYTNYIRGSAPLMETDTVKLGDIFDHDLLYKYYPTLKDVKVEWTDGYGAYYNPEADVITVGIDRFIGREMHEKGSGEHIDYASFGIDFERNATELMLHEIQHAIQMREMWTDSASLADSRMFRSAGVIMAGNISGVAGRTKAYEGVNMANEGGRSFYTDDKTGVPLNYSKREVLHSIMRLGNSPMHKHLRQMAYPNLIRVSGEIMLALADANMHHPEGHPARRNAQSVAKKIGAIRAEAIKQAEEFKSGRSTEDQMKEAICVQVADFEKIVNQAFGMLTLDNSPLAAKLYNSMDNSLRYMRNSMRALNGYNMIAALADADPAQLDIASVSVKLREVFDALSTMQYLAQKHEVEANLTETRSQMTQQELNSSGLNPDGSRQNVLDSISGAMDIGYKGKTLRSIGIALRNKTPIRVADMMIGGTGDRRLNEASSSDTYKMLGRGALISWTVKALHTELRAMNIVSVFGNGWEVGADGKPRLINKSALVRTKKPISDYESDAMYKSATTELSGSTISRIESGFSVFNAVSADGSMTVSMDDIIRLIDGIVVNENEIRTPTEAMDTVLSDNFPSVIELNEVEAKLRELGVSEDGIVLSNVELLTVLPSNSHTVTKGELVDLMALFHRQFVNERVVSMSAGPSLLSGLKLDPTKITPQILANEVRKRFRDGNGGDQNSAYSFFESVFHGSGDHFDLNIVSGRDDGRGRVISNSDTEGVRGGFLGLKTVSGRLVVVPNKPSWIDQESWDLVMKKWEASGLFNTDKYGVLHGTNTYDSIQRIQAQLGRKAAELNRTIAKKLFLIKPFYEKALQSFEDYRGRLSSEDADKMLELKISLLDEMVIGTITPELDAFRTDEKRYHRGLTVSAKRETGLFDSDLSRTTGHLGLAADIYSTGYTVGADGLAFVELQSILPVAGFTSTNWNDSPYERNVREKDNILLTAIASNVSANLHDKNMGDVRENLVHVANSSVVLLSTIRGMLDGGMPDTVDVNKLRVLLKVAESASKIANTSTLLIGDSNTSGQGEINRNIQAGQDYSTLPTAVIQESLLLRGYRGNDKSLVISENILADTISGSSRAAAINLPFYNNPVLPAAVGDPKTAQAAVTAYTSRDMAVRSVLFGNIFETDPLAPARGPLSYIEPIIEMVASMGEDADAFDVDFKSEEGNQFTSGTHALHSALYIAAREFQVTPELNDALSASGTFYTEWGGGFVQKTLSKNTSGVTGFVTLAAFAPIFASVMGEKGLALRNGKLIVRDLLSPQQRENFNALREAYRDGDHVLTGEKIELLAGFFGTLSETQKGAIISNSLNSNTAVTVMALMGVMNARHALDSLPPAAGVDAIFNGDYKKEFRRQLELYLVEGKYMWESGTADVAKANGIFENRTPSWLSGYIVRLMHVPKYQHLVMATLAKMDIHSKGYIPLIGDKAEGSNLSIIRNRLAEGEDMPVSALRTYVSPNPFSQNQVTAPLDGKIHLSGPPNRSHSWGPNDGVAYVRGSKFIEGALNIVLSPMPEDGPQGLADALLRIYDPMQVGGIVGSDAPTLESNAPAFGHDEILGVHQESLPKRGMPISQKLARQSLVESVVKQARMMNTDVVSLEPARFRNSGRRVSHSFQGTFEGEDGRMGLGNKVHMIGASSVFSIQSHAPSGDDYGTVRTNTPSVKRPLFTTPMRGFAWKRLEDGRIVINMTGDHTGYKAGYLAKQVRPNDGYTPRAKIPIGFSIKESLGYDPYSGDISPAGPYLTLFGDMSLAGLSDGNMSAGMDTFFQVKGEAWRKQIIKSALTRLKNGDQIRGTYVGTAANKKGIKAGSSSQLEGIQMLMTTPESAHTDARGLAAALSVIHHSTGHQYVSITLPANATSDMIFAVIGRLMLSDDTHFMAGKMNRSSAHGSEGASPFLGDGELLYGDYYGHKLVNQGYGVGGTKMTQLLGEETSAAVTVLNADSISDIMKLGVTKQGSTMSSGASLDKTRARLGRDYDLATSRDPRIIADIQSISEMVLKKEHGWTIPDAERHLAKNGDTTLAIELMFPNRPELTQYAWDSKESNGVNIVHRGPKAKPTGYFVTYNLQTGIDINGDPIMAKKVVPVNTLAEAEALRNKFGIISSKAILAQVLTSAGFEGVSVKDGVYNASSNTEISPQRAKALSLSDGNLRMNVTDSYHVGDTDKQMSQAEASAIAAVLSKGDVLQTKLPSVTVRSANLMLGDKSSRELEGMLRRKLTFGFGSGPVEFVSKMMRVVAYGRKKSGREAYPDAMTGSEWFKFMKENNVSKDEIRMTGVAFLLHDNMNTLLTRKDLAEFIYTVYPKTSRQMRRPSGTEGPIQNTKLRAGSLSGIWDMPYLEDIQTKENFVINSHIDNLRKVNELIEKKLLEPDSAADAAALRDSLLKSIDFTIKEMGMPESLSGKSLLEAIDMMAVFYSSSTQAQADGTSPFGPVEEARMIRPAPLEYVMKEAIFGRLGDQYRTIEASLGDLGLINPYEIQHADTSSQTNPFDLRSSGTMLSINRNRFFGVDSPPNVPIYNTQGFYFHGGNYHGGWATFKGFYQSNPIFSENWNKRMKAEFKAAVKELTERLKAETSPERKKAISSVIDSLVRVESARVAINSEAQLSDLSHYSDNDSGTFQLGHIRSTQTILNGEYGIASSTEPAFHGNDEVSGFNYQPEVVVAIEEIQSDSFQYQTFGETTKVSKALPDSLEQVDGFKFASELTQLKEQLSALKLKANASTTTLQNSIQKTLDARRGGDMRMNMAYVEKLMEMLSPYDLYMMRDEMLLEDTGRTIAVPEPYRRYIGKDRIPVLRLDLRGQWYKSMEQFKHHETLEAVSRSMAAARGVSSTVVNTAYDTVLRSLLPDVHMGIEMRDRTVMNRYLTWDHDLDGSGSDAIHPSLVFSILASQDPEIVASAEKIAVAHGEFRADQTVDWDGIAKRTLERIISMKDEVMRATDGLTGVSKFARAKMFDALVQTYAEAITSPRNQSMAVSRSMAGERIKYREVMDIQPDSVAYEIVRLPSVERAPQRNWFPDVEMATADDGSPMRPDMRGKLSKASADEDVANYNSSSYVQFIAGSNALAQTMATMVAPWISTVHSMGVLPKQIEVAEAKLKELSAKVPVSTKVGNEPQILNSMPFGVEDIYKPIALNGTVIRAANAGLGAITYADARHQVNRGHSMDVAATFMAGRDAHMILINGDTFKGVMTTLSLLPRQTLASLHGGLFDRVSKMSTDEVLKYVKKQGAFEHNGVSGPMHLHIALVIKEAVPILASAIPDTPTSYLFDDSSTGRLMHQLFVSDESDIRNLCQNLVINDNWSSFSSELLSPDGTPYKPKDNGTPFFTRAYGKVQSGDKNDSQRLIDSAVANIGQQFFWSEKGRAMGYVSQYGGPSWFINSIMFGQKQSAIDRFSTDAFARPIVQVSADGSYALLDSKTGRVIMENITNKTMLRELFFQNSKYLGGLPYIARFLSEWSPVGAYVTQGHSNGGNYGGDLVAPADLTVPSKQAYVKDGIKGVLGDVGGSKGQMFTNEASKSMSGLGDITNHTGTKMWFTHALKVNVSDKAQMANALNTFMSCGGPVLRFKPNFPSEMHKKAFRRKIVEGIALLMPSGRDGTKAEATPEVLSSLTRMYKNFSKVTGARKTEQKGEALEDEDESSRP